MLFRALNFENLVIKLVQFIFLTISSSKHNIDNAHVFSFANDR